MKYILTLLLFVCIGMSTQTVFAVDSELEEKPQVEISQDIKNISTPITIADDLQYHQIIDLQPLNVATIKNEQSTIRQASDTEDRLNKLFRQADKSFISNFNSKHGKFNYKNILKFPLQYWKDNFIRSPSN